MKDTRVIQYNDNTTNQVVTFQAKERAETTLICLPAMGVRASYYEAFATNLCGHGFVDMQAYADYFDGKLSNHEFTEDELLGKLPEIEALQPQGS